MFANRFTAFVDACSLVGALKRNLLLSLAEADFYRIRWSREVLEETERAIGRILAEKGANDGDRSAARARSRMEEAFADAMVESFGHLLTACEGLPDPNDAHVVAAALKTRADMIVTDNLRHFPLAALAPLNLEVRSTDAFIADTIALDAGTAVASVKRMRLRLKRPEKTPEALLLDMEADGLTDTVDILRAYVASL